MEGSEYLYTVAEVSVAFVGFASIVLAVRHRSGTLVGLDRILISWLIERGLAVLAFALLPLLLHHFEIPTHRTLRISSGLLATYFLITSVRVSRVARHHRSHFLFGRLGGVLRLLIVVAMIPVQAAAALGFLPFAALGWYLLGVSWLLLAAGILFSTILTAYDA